MSLALHEWDIHAVSLGVPERFEAELTSMLSQMATERAPNVEGCH